MAEAIIQPGADDVEMIVAGKSRGDRGCVGEMSEVRVEIFDLPRPIAIDGAFDACARGPARRYIPRTIDDAVAGENTRAGEGSTTRGVEEIRTVGDAEPDACAREGIELRRAAARGTSDELGRLHARPVEIALEAEYPIARLPIVAGGAADQRSANVHEHVGLRLIGRAPKAAGIHADIKACPVEKCRRGLIGWCWHRHVGGERGYACTHTIECGDSDARDEM